MTPHTPQLKTNLLPKSSHHRFTFPLRTAITNYYLELFFTATQFVTHAGIVAGVGRAFSRVCLSVCPRSNSKMA